MQTVANCITDILQLYGIHSRMYLDDLIIFSPNRDLAWEHYKRARDLLVELGLPEAMDKTQPPIQRIKWLSIIINTREMTLSIPAYKLKTLLQQVRTTYHKQSKRQFVCGKECAPSEDFRLAYAGSSERAKRKPHSDKLLLFGRSLMVHSILRQVERHRYNFTSDHRQPVCIRQPGCSYR